MVSSQAALDPQRVEQFQHAIVGDLAAAMSAVLVHIGDRLGLYRAMADGEPLSPSEVAARSGLAERYVREWLHNQAAAGWVTYDGESETFRLPPEHALLVADETAPTFMLGAFDLVAAAWADEAVSEEAFRSGAGVGWHQHDDRLFCGVERFFAPGYRRQLVADWLPALDGVIERLECGISVADVGCGFGAATILLGERFPASRVTGFDYHDASIAAARQRAAAAGVGNVDFEVAASDAFPGEFDLICLFDCLHDMGDPVRAARHARERLRDGGTLLVVEPAAGDRPEENHHLLGRLFYAASTLVCTPASLDQPGAAGLGNQVGPARLSELLAQAGFSQVRVAAQSPLNLVLEARA